MRGNRRWEIRSFDTKILILLNLYNSINLRIFIVRSIYSYCSATLTEVFPCFFLSCKANPQDGERPALFQIIFVLFHVLFVLCRSVYCLCVNVYCTAATGCQPN
jgi:hypothetical protein